MNNKKKVLGRGLAALLGNTDEKNILDNKLKLSKFSEIDIRNISSNPLQPRRKFKKESINELAISIKSLGIIQPITVRKINNDGYQLISGERRLRACAIAGIKKIPAYIRKVNEEQMLEMALIENIQREDLNSLEIAKSYKRLIEQM